MSDEPKVKIPLLRKGKPPIGLGSAIKRATEKVGIKPCSGCKKRAAWLNKRVAFTAKK